MSLHPDIKKYYVFRALVKRFALPVIVLYGLDIGLSLTQLSIIAAIGVVASLLTEIPSGAIADSLGHRKTMIWGMLGQAAAMGLYFGGTFEWMLAATVVYFTTGSLVSGTSKAFFFERLKELGLDGNHAKLYGQGRGFATAVSVISMGLAGVLYETAWHLPFIVGIIQFLIAAWVISLIPNARQQISVAEEETRTSPFHHLGVAWREVRHEPRVLWLSISSALVIGPLFAVGDFQQSLMTDLGFTATVIGVTYAVRRFLVIWVESFTHVIMRKVSAPVFSTICIVMSCGFFLLSGTITNRWLILIPLIVGSLSWVGLEVANNDYINQILKSKSRATALSISTFSRALFQLISIIIFGVVTLKAPTAEAFLIIGIILTVSSVYPVIKLFQSYRLATVQT